MMLSAGTPFVLLDDARADGRTLLYHGLQGAIRADAPADVPPALEQVRRAIAAGSHVAGYLAYEAGAGLEPRLAAMRRGQGPMLWFGSFRERRNLDGPGLETLLGDPAGAWIGALRPGLDRARYDVMHARVQSLIAAGDIYQANLSFRSTVPLLGSPLAAYAQLRAGSRAGWGGVVHDGARWLLSLSPELFFRTDGHRIEARPMKGTAPRGVTPAEDDANAAALAADPKERAENLMIVDLLRNDLSRVAEPGSVRVPRLFAVERYPTVQQMVSEVTAELSRGCDAVDVIEALFPCGSITGAPKVRAMEIIDAIEEDGRGAYTGAIGAFDADDGAAFNVAIRTLVLEEGAIEASIGLGSAVVADSTADGEWRECLAKARFLHAGARPFDLIETMRFDPDEGVIDLERHIARLKQSAAALGFRFDRHGARNELHTSTFRLMDGARVRLRLARGGAVAIETAALPPAPAAPLRVAIVPLPVDPRDFRLRHKTSDRAFYAAARAAAGTDEVVFALPDGRLTEGSYTSLFAQTPDGLVTPPSALPLLPGILREAMLADGRAREGELRAADLAGGFLLGNALRGLLPARLV